MRKIKRDQMSLHQLALNLGVPYQMLWRKWDMVRLELCGWKEGSLHWVNKTAAERVIEELAGYKIRKREDVYTLIGKDVKYAIGNVWHRPVSRKEK